MGKHPFDKFALLAEGGQSWIYQYAADKVLRVPKREADYSQIEYEFKVYKFLEGTPGIPRVHEFMEMDGIPCIVMEKIEGMDLFTRIKSELPFTLKAPKLLAEQHTRLFSVNGPEFFRTNHSKARFCIRESTVIPEGLKAKLIAILENLPHGKAICHGDFHPGNIIESGKSLSIVDWSSATVGSPLFDIAHTYLLLTNTPRLEGTSGTGYFLQRIVTEYIGRRYLRYVCEYNGITADSLFPFLLVKAGERSYYGMESEKKWLADFIQATIDMDSIDMGNLRKYA